MRLGNAVIALLLISIISKLTEGKSILEGVQNNYTTGLLTSPWLKKAMNHGPRPRPLAAGACRGHVERDYIHLQLECGVVETDVLMSLRICPFTWRCCRGFCVNVNGSPFNCGRCGNRCPWRVRCVYGMCGYAQPFPPHPFPGPPMPHPPFPFPPRPPKPWPPHPPTHPGEDQPPSIKKLN
ncbi:unnamed protein product [Dovyalis caffra]|uniref:Stigma-specific protein Stig1 n=1 Tax=Dovyalis caffra TaxID=77055 RepID=A0AAV1SGH2_9ROSI|nr:unnamed protein product [Dovyalis caffra]